MNNVTGPGSIQNVVARIPAVPGIENGNSRKEAVSGMSFYEYLNEALDNISESQRRADEVTTDFIAGKTENLHGMMIEAEKANLILQFTMQIRNKILDAYNEIMRMQI